MLRFGKCALLLTIWAQPAIAQTLSISTQEATRFVDSIRTALSLPGLVVIAARSNGEPQIIVSGVRKVGTTDSIRATDRMHLGSNGKAITATMIGALVEQHRLSFETTLADAFPDLVPTMRSEYRGVTIRQLLGHSAGIRPYTDLREFGEFVRSTGDRLGQRREFAARILAEKPAFPPGTNHAYSNAGVALAGIVAERITRQSYETLVDSLVFRPLGGRAWFGNPGADTGAAQPFGHTRARGRQSRLVDPLDVEFVVPSVIAAAGDASPTLIDYGKFLQMHLRGMRGIDGVLKAATIKDLHTAIAPLDGATKFAAGWGFARTPDGFETHGHTGSGGAYIAIAAIQAARDLAIAIITNIGGDSDVLPAVSTLRPIVMQRLAGAAQSSETPSARALFGWLRAYNGGNPDSIAAFARRAYAASELRARSPEAIARGQQLWRQNYGHFELLRVDTSTTYAMDAFVRHGLTGAIGKVYLEVDSVAPHGITGVYLLPFMRPPADIVRRSSTTDPQVGTELSAYAARLAAADVLSGTVMVQRGDSVVFAGAYGQARREPPLANALDTRFELASLSKLFTAVAIAQLVERGQLQFESTLAQLLPGYPNRETASRITVHHLLTHTSGLPDFYRNGKIRQYEGSIRSLEDYWPAFALDSLWAEPGSRHDYSNSNYIVLGAIVERLSGLAFETYVDRFIFAPAGMADTCYCDMDAPRRAMQYSRYTAGFGPTRRSEPDRWIEVPPSARRPGAPAGGGISTAADLGRFGAALLRNQLVSAAMLRRMLTPYVGMEGDGHRGYGFEISEWFGTRFVGHGGNFWGVMSQLDIYPETGHVVVVLSNNDASGGEALRNLSRRILSGVR